MFAAALSAPTLLAVKLLALLSTVRLLHLLVLDLIEAGVVPFVFCVRLAYRMLRSCRLVVVSSSATCLVVVALLILVSAAIVVPLIVRIAALRGSTTFAASVGALGHLVAPASSVLLLLSTSII